MERISSSSGGETIDIHCPDGHCRIPAAGWRRLLQSGKNGRLTYDVFVRGREGAWKRFQPLSNRVAEEPIDSYIVYRLLEPNKNRSRIHGIFQRNLESFE